MFYLVLRNDCESFKVADDIDQVYGKALISAKRAGVEFVCYSCRISPTEIVLDNKLPVSL